MRELVDALERHRDHEIACFEGGRVVRRPYAQLRDDVRVAVAALRSAGVGARDHVGLCGANSYRWMVLDLACIELDAVSAAIAPDTAALRGTQALCDELDLALLITDAPAPTTDERHICGFASDEIAGAVARRADPEPVPADAFTMAFSSGTTGTPKAILMSAEGTLDAVAEYDRQLGFRESDSIFVVLPLSAFPQRLMGYIALLCGFDIQLATVADLMSAAVAMKPTIVVGPPAFFEPLEARYRGLAAAGEQPRAGVEAFGGNVRLALTGAAPAQATTITTLNDAGFPLVEFYGMTEVSVISWNLPGHNRPGSAGRELRPGLVRLAADGEITVRVSPQRSHGYYRDPALTERTYGADGWVATGDLGRFDGEWLYVTGRKKSVIVTRGGYKLQPEPIEQALCADPAVAHAVVLGGEHARVLTAVVSLSGADGGDAAHRLREIVQRHNGMLPEPARIARLVVAGVGFTPGNGLLTRTLKVDRDAVSAALASTTDQPWTVLSVD